MNVCAHAQAIVLMLLPVIVLATALIKKRKMFTVLINIPIQSIPVFFF